MPVLLLFLLLTETTVKSYNPTDLPLFVLDSVVVKGETQNLHAVYTVPDSIIEKKNATFNEEILNFLPSLNFAYSSKGYGTLNFRGNDAKRITILFDGVPYNLPYSGTFDISEIPSDFLKSVSLISASYPVIAKKNAIGGIVSITSPRIRKMTKIKLSVGTEDALKSSAFIGDTMRNVAYLIGYSFERINGFSVSSDNPYGIKDILPNSYFIRKGILGKTRIVTPFGTFKGNLLFINNEKGVPPDLATERPRYWRFPVWQRKTLSLQYDHKTLQLGVYHDSYYNVLDSYDDSTYQTQNAPYAFHSTYDDYSMGGYIQIDQAIRRWKFLSALTFKKDVHREQPDYKENWTEIKAYLINCSLYSKRSFSRTTFEASLEGLFRTQGPTKLIYPQFNVSVAKKLKRHNVFFAISRRIRFPSLKEMYSTYSGTAYPNPDLKPETSYNIEINSTTEISGLKIYLSVYHSRITQLIQKIRIDSLYKTINIESAKLSGFESVIKGYLSNIAFSIFVSYNHGKNSNGTLLNLVPEIKAGISISKPFVLGSILYTEVLYTGKRNEITKRGLHIHSPFTIANVMLTRKYKNLHLFLKINNIFDTFYEYQLGIPAKGLYAETGVKISIQ